MTQGEEGNSLGNAFAGVEKVEKKNQEAENSSKEEEESSNTELKGDIDQAVEASKSGKSDTRSGKDSTSNQSRSESTRSGVSSTVDKSSAPHRVRYDSPTDKRDSLNIYVDSGDKQRLNDLKNLAEREFDESINMIDVYLAALRSDFYNDESFLNEMRNIGYDYFNN